MKKNLKILITAILSFGIMIQMSAHAAEFSDMPNNWTTKALKSAVENGILNGADGKIMPDNNIKRSEMAAMIVRSLGASKTADLSAFTDVSASKWYYNEFSKAVAMRAFSGTDDNKLMPEANITYEECFTVLSRIFHISEFKLDDLDGFSDKETIAGWAKENVAKLVTGGYWNGHDGKLKPSGKYITRAEVAVLFDNIIKTYINTPGEYTIEGNGGILIRSNGVTLKDVKSSGIIVIGDGVSQATLTDILSTGKIVARGGITYITGILKNVSMMSDGVEIFSEKFPRGKIYGEPSFKTIIHVSEKIQAFPTE